MTTSRTLGLAIAIGLALLVAACGSSAQGTAAPVVSDSAAPSAPASAGPTPAASVPAVSAAPSPVATASGSPDGASAGALDCTAPVTPTLAQTEGPYYVAGAPEDADLVTDAMAGTRLTVTGFVVDTACAPVAGAKVETWQADASGAYDNAGYSLRGWVVTDADGRFTIRTVVPGEYPGRTEHIHVKVTPLGGATLTTQVYFPGSTANGEDGIYDPSLDLAITQDGDALVGEHTFVIAGQ